MKNKKKYEKIIDGCTVLDQIINKLRNSGSIQKKEVEILISLIKNVEDGPPFLKKILSRKMGYSEEKIEHEINNVDNFPISCEDIRKIIREKNLKISLKKCNCIFSDDYNCPLNYILEIEKLIKEKVEIELIIEKIFQKREKKVELNSEIDAIKKLIKLKIPEGKSSNSTYGKVILEKPNIVKLIL